MDAAAAADVENAVRRFFASGELTAAGGPVLALCESIRALELDSKSEITIRSLTVISTDEDEALVELDAAEVSVSRVDRGRKQRAKADLTGPVRVRREHGDWKVVDHSIDGRPVSESFLSLGGDAVQVQGVSLRLASILVGRKDIGAFVEIENRGGEQATIGSVSLAAKRCRCAGGQTRTTFEPGSSSTVVLGWRKSLPSRIRILRLELVVRTSTGQHAAVSWTVDLQAQHADAAVRKRARLRVLLAKPIVPGTILGSFIVGHSLVFGMPPLSFFACLGLTMAYVFVHPWLHSR